MSWLFFRTDHFRWSKKSLFGGFFAFSRYLAFLFQAFRRTVFEEIDEIFSDRKNWSKITRLCQVLSLLHWQLVFWPALGPDLELRDFCLPASMLYHQIRIILRVLWAYSCHLIKKFWINFFNASFTFFKICLASSAIFSRQVLDHLVCFDIWVWVTCKLVWQDTFSMFR